MRVVVNNLATTVSRIGSKRAMSQSAEPRMHKAKDVWVKIKETRPPEGHPHNVFHPPYNKVAAGVGVVSIVVTGYGTMYYGMSHQQYKQGYW
eukprot:CAMPEP_0184855268 /NCGR_PEP_ID=MMETSP0580-20130426/566_1 /TAXON_ID=1118495 /ORGANISM="Dactyliosolen fragilissimus" /LENGTH=91 /DNA_ID=CAMNT_0027349741 /DNA_START=39 /DNA_END=311 /DNA_ORIENTATION=+